MAVIYHKNTGDVHIVVWRITEDACQLSACVTEEDRHSATRFTSPSRKIQHMAARAALRTILPHAKISYKDSGAPVVSDAGDVRHIGFSHCPGAAAAILSGSPCAVDIENRSRNFSRASVKFISPVEGQLHAAGHPLFMASMWCAKETLYKFTGIPGLDFLRDLEITSVDMAPLGEGGEAKVTARVKTKRGLTVSVAEVEEFVVCYM